MASGGSQPAKKIQFDAGFDGIVIAENNRLAFNNRIFVSILLGIGAGVLGLENLWGVIFYLVGSAVGLALFLIINTGLGKQDIFFTKWKEIFTVSMSTNLFTFVMVWTLFYDIVHVYV